MSDDRFDLASARRAATAGRTAAWVDEFLVTEGGNEALAAGLAQDEHWWAGPVFLPLEALEPLAGPEGEDRLCPIDPEEWQDDVEGMEEQLEDDWEPPPLLAQYERGRLLLQDGNHRYEALRRDGAEGAWVIVYFDDPSDRERFMRSRHAS